MTNRRQRSLTGSVLVLAITALAFSTACRPRVFAKTSPLNPQDTDVVTFTVWAEDGNGLDEIQVIVNGSVVKTCAGVDTCSFTGGPYPGADQGYLSYSGVAKDTGGFVGSVGPYAFAVGRPWNNETWVTIRDNQEASADSIDVCFIMDSPSYGGNLHNFLADVEDKIFARYMRTDRIKQNERKYKFHYTMQPGLAANCGNNLANLPVFAAGPHCDAFAVLRDSDMRDCSIGSAFSAEGRETQAFIHESGHAVFGLADEYEGDTSYHQPSPHANIWADVFDGSPSVGKLLCEMDITSYGGDPNACDEFCDDPGDCNYGWWRYTTNTTVMTRGFFDDAWGLPALKRVGWVHDKY